MACSRWARRCIGMHQRSLSGWPHVGGHPGQAELMTGRSVLTTAYAVMPRDVMRDIVTSVLPFWRHSRTWILARPLSGFAETFCQYIVEVEAGGGSTQPDTATGVESVLFMLDGELDLDLAGSTHSLRSGAYVYVSADEAWTLEARSKATFVWIRKRYEAVVGLSKPESFVVPDETAVPAVPMPGTNGTWATTRFVDPSDIRHDMHVNIVTFKPGAVIPFKETHVMEHGIFVLQGKAVYHLNSDWVEVQQGDFLWLRAFCPQACYAGGPSDFRYLLYKDVNRHPSFLAPAAS